MRSARKKITLSILTGAAIAGSVLAGAASAAQAEMTEPPLSQQWEGGLFDGSGSNPILSNGNTQTPPQPGQVPDNMSRDFVAGGKVNGAYVYYPANGSVYVTQGAVDAFNQAKNNGQPFCAATGNEQAITCPN